MWCNGRGLDVSESDLLSPRSGYCLFTTCATVSDSNVLMRQLSRAFNGRVLL